MTSSGKACREKALAERAVNRRRHARQRQRCPPSRVWPSRRVAPLPHRTQSTASSFTIQLQELAIVLPTCLQQNLAKWTVQKYLRDARPPQRAGQTWAAFLRNHAPDIWAC